MTLSANTEHWLDRLRTETAKVRRSEWPVLSTMQLAEVECAFGLHDDAQETLSRSLQGFGGLHPGVWSALATRAARLSGRLAANRLLEPEIQRGLDWLAQPEIVQYQTGLPGLVRELAVQAGRADVAAQLVTDAWPGRASSTLVDACRIAGWARDASELRRLLPQTRAALQAAGEGPDHLAGPIGYWLVRACVLAGLLEEGAELVETVCCGGAPDELVIAAHKSADQVLYTRVRDDWVRRRIDGFRAEDHNFHWCSGSVRHAAETIRRLGDAAGYRHAVEQFRAVAAVWAPPQDWLACVVNCDLAVMYAFAGEEKLSAGYMAFAKRLFEGKEPGVPTARGNRSLMAAVLSAAHRDLGQTDLALRFAKKSSHSGDRQMHLLSALILGGRLSEAEDELAVFDAPEDRACRIGDSLLAEFKTGSSSALLLICQDCPTVSAALH